MKVNFGCGKKILDGWFNIDAELHPCAERSPELLFEMRFADGKLIEQIPLDDGCADELQSIHVIEHFHRFNADAVIGEFKRLLRPGGRLVLECPNIESAARNLLAGMGDNMSMWPLYGSPKSGSPFVSHLWGYTPKTLSALVAFHGFKDIHSAVPLTHHSRSNRDMRVEAVRA